MSTSLKRPFFTEHAYSGSAFVWRILEEQGEYILEFIDEGKLEKPSKKTVLHDFIEGVYEHVICETFYDYPDTEISSYLNIIAKAGLSLPAGLFERLKYGEYESDDLDAAYDVIIRAVLSIEIPSVFNMLFSDKNFIQNFQTSKKNAIRRRVDTDAGAFPRISRVYIPVWLRKGIFYRDRGRCQICDRDLSGIFSPEMEIHLDHIIPLADYGNNDPTNFQLTCSDCNLRKSDRVEVRRSEFVAYWAED